MKEESQIYDVTKNGFRGAKVGTIEDAFAYLEFAMLRMRADDVWATVLRWMVGAGRHPTGEQRRSAAVTAKVYAAVYAIDPGMFGDGITLTELSLRIGLSASALAVHHAAFQKRFNFVAVAARPKRKSNEHDEKAAAAKEGIELLSLDALPKQSKVGSLPCDFTGTGQASQLPDHAAFEGERIVPKVPFDYDGLDRELTVSAYQRALEREGPPVVSAISQWLFTPDPFDVKAVTHRTYAAGLAYGIVNENQVVEANLNLVTVQQHAEQFREQFIDDEDEIPSANEAKI
jgi:hypothetical protein